MYLKIVMLFDSFVSISLSVDLDFFNKLSQYFATYNILQLLSSQKALNKFLTNSALRQIAPAIPSLNFELITLAQALSSALKNNGSFLKVSAIKFSYFWWTCNIFSTNCMWIYKEFCVSDKTKGSY